jgi:hypothetical protein
MFQTTSPIDASTVNLIINAGAVGVLFMVSLAAVLWIWTRRGIKPVDATAGTNMAINAFAEMFKNQNEQIEADRELRKEEQAARRQQITELNEHYIESISANADATNRNADNLKLLTELMKENHIKQVADVTAIKVTVEKIDRMGSDPLQKAIEALTRIEETVNQISKRQSDDKMFFSDALAKISSAKDMLTHGLEDVRATGTLATVTVPEQELKVETANGAGEAAA